MNKAPFKFMGVINLTPNSFSDGGKVASPEAVLELAREHYQYGAEALDIGAESTAPSSEPITAEEEIARFETYLYPVLDEILKLRLSISIDTYKTEVFKHVAQHIYSKDGKANLIWNDVSGSLDAGLIETLEVYPNVSYVFSHNLAPKRSLTSSHMKYVDQRLEVEKYFRFALEELSFHKNIILDPCFGFSKTHEQNWELIKSMPDLANSFAYPWLLGVSRKSFFGNLAAEYTPENSLSYRENLHSQVLYYWAQNLPQGPYFIRLHDIAVGQITVKGQQLLT